MEMANKAVDADRGDEAGAAWHPAKKLLFRFTCIYFALYVFPFPLSLVPRVGVAMSLFLRKMLDNVIPWVGEHVLLIPYEIDLNNFISSDDTYGYVQLFVYAVAALAGCLLWTLLDRNRRHYQGLARWLTVGCRYYLAAVILGYGFAKLFQYQFPFLGLERLLKPYGDSSPMSLLWSFMGYSSSYNLFTGGAEVLGGLLLLFRRTATLGALVVVGVASNIVMLNFNYDVPVKIISSHLLMMAVALLVPDFRKFLNVFVLGRPVPGSDLSPHFVSRRWNIAARVIKTAFIGIVLYQDVSMSLKFQKLRGETREKPALYGIWEVESFVKDGETIPPLLTEVSRWRRLVVDYLDYVSVQRMDDAFQRYAFKLDEESKTFELSTYQIYGHFNSQDQVLSEDQLIWTYDRPSEGVLIVEGKLQGSQFSIEMVARDPRDFLLVQRGFHWITEVPLNR